MHVGKAWPRTGQDTLKITIQNGDGEIGLKLEGRVAGPWVAELDRVWVETAPQLGKKTLSIDLQHVIYADGAGKQVLRDIYAQTHAEFVATTPWTQFLAEEVTANKTVVLEEGE